MNERNQEAGRSVSEAKLLPKLVLVYPEQCHLGGEKEVSPERCASLWQIPIAL